MNCMDYLKTEKFPLFWCPGCGNGVVLDRWGELRLPELHESDDEPLLGAVVEVAFDPTALDLIGRDDLPSRGRELSDPPGGEGLVRGRGPVEPSLRKGELHAPKVPCLVSPCPRRRDPTKVYPALLLPECGHYRDRIGDTME